MFLNADGRLTDGADITSGKLFQMVGPANFVIFLNLWIYERLECQKCYQIFENELRCREKLQSREDGNL